MAYTESAYNAATAVHPVGDLLALIETQLVAQGWVLHDSNAGFTRSSVAYTAKVYKCPAAATGNSTTRDFFVVFAYPTTYAKGSNDHLSTFLYETWDATLHTGTKFASAVQATTNADGTVTTAATSPASGSVKQFFFGNVSNTVTAYTVGIECDPSFLAVGLQGLDGSADVRAHGIICVATEPTGAAHCQPCILAGAGRAQMVFDAVQGTRYTPAAVGIANQMLAGQGIAPVTIPRGGVQTSGVVTDPISGVFEGARMQLLSVAAWDNQSTLSSVPWQNIRLYCGTLPAKVLHFTDSLNLTGTHVECNNLDTVTKDSDSYFRLGIRTTAARAISVTPISFNALWVKKNG